MIVEPSVKACAVAAARYLWVEFPAWDAWSFHEDELAVELLKQESFVCAIEYTIAQVAKTHSGQMRAAVAEYGGFARVVGRVVGEWTTGGTTLDRELESYG